MNYEKFDFFSGANFLIKLLFHYEKFAGKFSPYSPSKIIASSHAKITLIYHPSFAIDINYLTTRSLLSTELF